MTLHFDRPLNGGMLIYDGECGFCTNCVAWVARAWPPTVVATPWQQLGEAGLARYGLTVADAAREALWVDPGGRVLRGHRAVAGALRAGRGWRRAAGQLLLSPAASPSAGPIYRWVADHRHRLPRRLSADHTGASTASLSGRAGGRLS